MRFTVTLVVLAALLVPLLPSASGAQEIEMRPMYELPTITVTAPVETDPLYDRAVAVVIDTGRCTSSWIQRKLAIGYRRAAELVEMMEKNGLIGPPRGSKPREIHISAL